MSLTTEATYPRDAKDFLVAAADTLDNRAALRDAPNGERSIARAVEIFHALSGHRLSERDGVLFLMAVKLARAERGKANADDYVDLLGYGALLAEASMREPPTRNLNALRDVTAGIARVAMGGRWPSGWPGHP